MGFRGIPANYGGFETFAEELAPRLVRMGHDVTVYCRSNSVDPALDGAFYKGVRLKVLPTIGTKYLDTVAHTFISSLHGLGQGYDAVLMLNAANSPFAAVSRLGGAKVALNVDGIERLRKKWGLAGRLYYRLGEYLATVVPNAIVSDADVIRDYYLKNHGADSVMIPYGSDVERAETTGALERAGVTPGEYILYVSRLEPENNAHIVIEAFKGVDTGKRLVVVGDAPYASAYKDRLRELAAGDARVVLAGAVYGLGYRELQSHAYCYVQATEVGGTHPALVEAMGFGNCVVVNGTPENVEVVGDAGLVYGKNDVSELMSILERVMHNPEIMLECKLAASARARERYSWERVAQDYETLFRFLTEGRAG